MESAQLQLLVDKRNIRWFQILASLERFSNLSTTKLSKSLNISARTITSDIKEIRAYFDQNITIVTSTNGYTFRINNKVAYIEQKKELLEYEPLLVILLGLFYGKTLSILDWADQLFLTDRTLSSYLKKLDPMLTRYQLKIDFPILSLTGAEINIRNFFLAFFYEEDTIPHYVFPPILISNIITDISTTKFEHFHLDVPRFKLSYLLYISYQRISNGKTLEINKEIVNTLTNSRLSSIMNQMKLSFKKHTSIQLEPSDLVYLIVMILDSNAYNDSLNLAPIYHEDVDLQWLPVIDDFCLELGVSNDTQAKAYIESFFYLNYLKNAVSNSCLFLPPSLLHYYKTHYKEELQTMLDFLNKYPNAFRIDNSTQFEYTLLLFSMRLMYELKQKKFNIAFLFEGPVESTTLLEDLARNYTPSIHNTYFFHAHTLLHDSLKNLSINLVVTNFSEYIFELPEGMDSLLFNYNATTEDWNKFIKHIDPRLIKKYKITFNSENED